MTVRYTTQEPVELPSSVDESVADLLDLLVEIAIARIGLEDLPTTTPLDGEDEP